VALAFFTPYDKPCYIDNTAPEPGDSAMMTAEMAKPSQVAKLMGIPTQKAHCSARERRRE
jgi:hypothetical protein